jgi:hypothetical protein
VTPAPLQSFLTGHTVREEQAQGWDTRLGDALTPGLSPVGAEPAVNKIIASTIIRFGHRQSSSNSPGGRSPCFEAGCRADVRDGVPHRGVGNVPTIPNYQWLRLIVYGTFTII